MSCVAVESGSGRDVLLCDPMMELVYQSKGVLSMKDLRSLAVSLNSKEVTAITEGRARQSIQRLASSLGELVTGGEVFSQRVRALVWDLESRMVQLEVPLWAVHPTLETPLVTGQLAPMAMYDELMGVGQALRAMTHPASWGGMHTNVWDSVAASTGVLMKPCLVLMLAAIIPVEARLSYITLRHAAYADAEKGVGMLGHMVSKILTKMMMYEYGPKDLHKVTKHLKQAGQALAPFSLYVMRACRTCTERSLEQRSADRAALKARLEEFLQEEGDKALYCRRAWIRFLMGLEDRLLLAFYIKFLYDGFQ